MMRPTIDEDFFEELEEILITSDIGMDTTVKVVETLRREVKANNMTKPNVIKIRLGKIIADLMDKGEAQSLCQQTPLIILMIGINGGGKTTTIGKLAYKLKKEGRTVMLAAADTFRAAAGEQLAIWGQRVGVNVIRHAEGRRSCCSHLRRYPVSKGKGHRRSDLRYSRKAAEQEEPDG